MATSRICSIPECGKPVLSRGWCNMHYHRWRHHGDPSINLIEMRPKHCTVSGCGKSVTAYGLCNAHYLRLCRHGNAEGGRPTMNGDPVRFLDEVALPYVGKSCLFWPFANNGNGYGRLKYGDRHEYPHRLICILKNGPPPAPNYDAAHSCGNGQLGCVNPMHLSWKTRADNIADKIGHGTAKRGANCNFTKLTEDHVREIRRLSISHSQASIAKEFNIDPSAVSNIVRRKTWAWLE